MRNERLDIPLGKTFEVARAALGSNAVREATSVYDLSPEKQGTFDLVFVGDLLLHLRSPLEALRNIRKVCTGRIILVDCFWPELDRVGHEGEFLVRYEGGWNSLTWWSFSLRTLAQVVADAGFEDVPVHGTYRLPNTHSSGPGWQRAILHAHV